jgi:anti-sigma factor RsiW
VKLTGDELEYALSQYHDGTLNPVERAAIDEILATDASARAAMAEIERLDALIKRTPAVPAIAWDKLQARISSAIADAEAPAVRTFKIHTWSRVLGGVVALAAAIAIVVSVTLRNRDAEPQSRGPAVLQIAVGPAGGAASTRSAASVEIGTMNNVAKADVAIGPSPQMASNGWPYDSPFLERPGHVVIAVSPEPGQDAGGGSSAPF